MKRTFILLLCLGTLARFSSAAPVPLDVKKPVVFIYAQVSATNVVPDGTGFLVALYSETITNQINGYLVTAKHVVCPEKTWLPNIVIRVNRNDGTSEQIRLPLIPSGSSKNVFVHDDPTVDVAVVPLFLPVEKFNVRYVTKDLLTTTNDFKSLGIHEGSDVFFPGMFVPHLGKKQNLPIVRFGRVAMMADEKVNWFGEETDLYLIEASAYGGNSGSPVFFSVGSERGDGSIVISTGGPVLKLAGVLTGHFNDALKVTKVSNGTNEVVFPNLGISTVVPSYRLEEILYSKELKELREKKDMP